MRSLLPVAVLLGMVTVPAPTASAAECFPADGADGSPPISQIQTEQTAPTWDREVSSSKLDPFAPDAHDVVFSGGGWGHGVGMSQYGAQGAAAHFGCNATQILKTYFPGTSLGTGPNRNDLRLKLWTTDASGVTSIWTEKATQWVRCNPDGKSCSNEVVQPAGATVQVSVTDDAFRIVGGGVDRTVPNRVDSVLKLRHDGKLIRVLQGAGDAASTGRPIRYGTLEMDFADLAFGQRLFTTEIITSGGASGLSAMETYLLGIAEVPWSWHAEALRAQVIAARSYAEARTAMRRNNYTDEERIRTFDCRCDLVVTTGDQVWAGAAKEMAEPTYYPNWKNAVVGTAGTYVLRDGQVHTTFYSSSHGGVSRAGFTSSSPGYHSVDASAWEKASGNSRYRWSQGLSRGELQAAFGIEDIDAIRITDTDQAGYPLPGGIEVQGVHKGEQVTRTYSPDAVRTLLGLLSPRFVVHHVRDLADDNQIPITRLAGDTRLETAIRLSKAGWSKGSDTVVLARQDNPADALTGSSLAGTHDAPLLLTPREGLAEAVKIELQRLNPQHVFMLGGPVALSEQVEADLQQLGIPNVVRVQGATRHGTAVDVATRVARGEQTTAYLVRLRDTEVESRGWVDALSVAAVAARRGADGAGWPILGTEEKLPKETVKAIGDLGITRVVPIGGPVTIPDSVLAELDGMGVEVADRLAGGDRYGTSRAVTGSDTPTTQSLVIATGENFPDGLAAGPYAARTGGALLLVRTELDTEASPWLPEQHPAFIRAYGWDEPRLVAVGGPVAITNPVISHTANVIESARPE